MPCRGRSHDPVVSVASGGPLIKSYAVVMVRTWRIARTTSDSCSLGYPKQNILDRCIKYGGTAGRGGPVPEPVDATDAEIIQGIVDKMPPEMRKAFEARELGLIDGQRQRHIPNKERARILGVAESTYWYRVNAGHQFISDWLTELFDSLESGANIRVMSAN